MSSLPILISPDAGNCVESAITMVVVIRSVIGVERVLPFDSRTRGIDLFDVRYQILLNDLYSIQSTDIIYYFQVLKIKKLILLK